MATHFKTFSGWEYDATIYPKFDYLVALPGQNGLYPFKVSDGFTPANRLPYAPNLAPFVVPPSSGGNIITPSSTTPGNLVLWGDSGGTTLTDGPSPLAFATAAQGALADTALQPGDDATALGSGAQPSGQVLGSNGTGGTAWVTPSAGSGITELTGPITAGPGTGAQATTVTPNAIDNTMLGTMPAGTLKGNGAATPADPADLTPNQASTILDGATDPFVRTSNLPVSGDVSGPASSTDGSFSRWDGATGKLLKDGVLPSTGGNGAADDALVVVYGAEGQLHGSAQIGGSYAVQGTATFGATGGYFTATNGTGIEASSVGGKGGKITTAADDIGLQVQNNSSTTQPALDVTNIGTADIAHFEGPTGGVQIKTDGGSQWSSSTGAQTTATNLPVFGSGTKGVVPAAPAIVGTTKFLREDGTWSVPPDTDTGITQLTGSVTAGPGNGSQVATVVTNANLTGPVTSVGNATTITPGVVTPAMLSTATQTPTPTTGQTRTFNTSSNNELIACLHSSTIAAQTFVIPTDGNSTIGQELAIFSRAAITTITMTANGNTVYGPAFTTIAAGGNYRIRKIAASTWVRIQ